MKNNIVLVTGSGRGSGEAIARRFLAEGAFVIATDVVKPVWGAKVSAENLLCYAMDVSDEKSVITIIQEVNQKTAGINVLVNNAGIAKETPLINETVDTFDKIFSVNMKGCFLTSREVCKHLISTHQPGSIINIASVAGKNGFQNSSLYGASKAAVIGFTRNLAPELGPYDITINAICPGSVDTEMLGGVLQNIARNVGISVEAAKKGMESNIPMRRLQKPEDVAALASFLASDGARNLSGESINLDGGVVRD